MANVTVEIEGLKELQAALLELPKNLAKNALRSAVNAGATVIRNEAKLRAPVFKPTQVTYIKSGKTVTTKIGKGHPPAGTLKRSIIQKYIRELSNEFVTQFNVTVRKGKKYNGQGKKGDKSQDAYYAYWVEKGNSQMAARPFLRPAFEAKKEEALEAMIAKLKERLEKEAAK